MQIHRVFLLCHCTDCTWRGRNQQLLCWGLGLQLSPWQRSRRPRKLRIDGQAQPSRQLLWWHARWQRVLRLRRQLHLHRLLLPQQRLAEQTMAGVAGLLRWGAEQGAPPRARLHHARRGKGLGTGTEPPRWPRIKIVWKAGQLPGHPRAKGGSPRLLLGLGFLPQAAQCWLSLLCLLGMCSCWCSPAAAAPGDLRCTN